MHALAGQKAYVARVVQVEVMLSWQAAHSRFDDCCELRVASNPGKVGLGVLELPDLGGQGRMLKAGLRWCSHDSLPPGMGCVK